VANKRQQKQYKTLLSVLASGSTPEARRLLKECTGEDAFSEQDLEQKLTRLYIDSTSKLDLEKDFADIHPHKDFILKYCETKSIMPMNEPINVNKLNSSNTEVVKQVEIITAPTKKEIENPTEGRACACGCGKFSNADGEQISQSIKVNLTIAVLGVVGIVAIVGTILYLKHDKK
jgi:hypothetical protein